MKQKRPTSFNLTDEARQLLLTLADNNGINKSSMMELLIRERAKVDNIRLPKTKLEIRSDKV